MMNRLTIIALAGSLLFAVSCDKNSEREDEEATEQASEKVDQASDEAAASDDSDEDGDEAMDDEQPEASGEEAAAESVNAFSHALFERTDEGNAVFSPTSISTAMAMVYAGAGGETAEQIASAMVYPDAAVESLGALSQALDGRDIEGDEKSLVLDIANDLWVDDGLDIGESYLETVDAEFGAEPTGLDFADAPDEARNEINERVAEQTREKIEELVSEEMITDQTRTILTNAVYFEGSWATPFDEEETQAASFDTGDEEVDVDMMKQTEYFRRGDGDNFKALQMGYHGDDLAALVVLPDEGAMDEVEADFDADTFANTVEELEREYVRLQFPRFEVQERLTLGETLQEMGIEAAFSEEADFDGIHPDLFLEAVVHEAVMEVDEEGTEAAAATAAGMGITSQPPEPSEFVVDRPFFFYVYDRPTGAIVFATRVVDPS